MPASDIMLSNFAAHLAASVRPGTVQVYLSAVRNLHLEHGYSDPCLEAPMLRRVLKGIARTHGSGAVAPRLPVTLPVLRKLLQACKVTSLLNARDRVMVRSAMLTAFFGFLRCSEFTGDHIRTYHVALSPSHLKIHLTTSKTDPAGRGVDIVIGAAEPSVCPVAAMRQYLTSSQRPPTSYLYEYSNGQRLTRERFTAIVRNLLASCGESNCSQYASHSFRIGAATTAAAAGVPESTIRAAGRWKSDACLIYIRTPDRAKAAVAAQMCSSDLAGL